MPRSNTEIDADLAKLQDLVATLTTAVEVEKIKHTELRDRLDIHVDHLSQTLNRVESALQRLAESQAAANTSLGRSRAEFDELRTAFQRKRDQRWGLWAGVVLAFLTAIIGMFKESLTRPLLGAQ